MKRLQEYIAARRSQFAAHPFFQYLRRNDSLRYVLGYLSELSFWVMGFQDLARLNEARTQDPQLRKLATHYRTKAAGYDQAFLGDILKIEGSYPDLRVLFGSTHAGTRDATYALLSEVFRTSSDYERLVLPLALQAVNQLVFEALMHYFERTSLTASFESFTRHHLDVERRYEALDREAIVTIASIELSDRVHQDGRELVDRVFDAMENMLAAFFGADGVKPAAWVTKAAPPLPPVLAGSRPHQDPSAVLGRYEIIKRLAVGGMSEVFLARLTGALGFEKEIVLKTIRRDLLAERAWALEMFRREAQLGALLIHPNIAQVFDFGESIGSYFLAIEYIDGVDIHTLRRCATSQGLILPDELCARIISLACEGLAFAHDLADPLTGLPLELVHRDVSPDNVLLSRAGAVKITDFGIAKGLGQPALTMAGEIKGKLAYMAPEQMRGEVIDRRADIYSLGVVLYELLSGTLPFSVDGDPEALQLASQEPSASILRRRSDLAPELVHVIERSLAKERSRRYSTCREMQDDLERFIASRGKPAGARELAEWVCRLTAASPQSHQPMASTVRQVRAVAHDRSHTTERFEPDAVQPVAR